MLPYWTTKFGNAASHHHRLGWEAEEAVRLARQQVARVIGADPRDIVFTSGATESNNLAIKGAAETYRRKGNHIITCATEHKCVIDVGKALAAKGYDVTVLPVDREGFVSPDDVRRAIRQETILISIMAANNEIGTLQPVREIGRMARDHGVLFHTDLAQAFGKISIHVDDDFIDLASLSAHKCYGPKGVGALYVRRKKPRVTLMPQMHGGGHEDNLRSGTLNVPGIVGFGKAAAIAEAEWQQDFDRTASLRQRLYDKLIASLSGVNLNGPDWRRHASLVRLPNNLNVSFEGVDAEGLIHGLKNLAVSTGSACMSAVKEPSYVLRAIGVDDALAHASIRFGLGRPTTQDDIDRAAERVISAVRTLRGIS
jgi:cysteine desulfurase